MKGCFTFQWGRFVFQMGGASFISGGHSMVGTSVLVGGGGGLKKIVRWGEYPPTLWETLKWDEKYQNGFAKTNKYLSVLNGKLKVSIIQFSLLKMV